MFITFEGIDGCGKSTQLQLLAQRLQETEYSVCVTREPGGTALAEAIRAHLLDNELGSKDDIDSRAELLLFGAARAQHVREIIRPALARREVVLCDRFTDSSLAYQGGGLGLDTDFIRAMNAFATEDLQPDATFFLDIEPKTGAARRSGEREDRIEKRGLEFQEKVRDAYLKIAQREPQRIVLLNAEQTREQIQNEIATALQQRGLNL